AEDGIRDATVTGVQTCALPILPTMTILLLALLGRVRMPWGLPGAFVAVVAGATIFWLRGAWSGETHGPSLGALRLAVPWPTLAWLDALPQTAAYLSVALPFALVTVIGGTDHTESAASAGAHYRRRDVRTT